MRYISAWLAGARGGGGGGGAGGGVGHLRAVLVKVSCPRFHTLLPCLRQETVFRDPV